MLFFFLVKRVGAHLHVSIRNQGPMKWDHHQLDQQEKASPFFGVGSNFDWWVPHFPCITSEIKWPFYTMLHHGCQSQFFRRLPEAGTWFVWGGLRRSPLGHLWWFWPLQHFVLLAAFQDERKHAVPGLMASIEGLHVSRRGGQHHVATGKDLEDASPSSRLPIYCVEPYIGNWFPW